MAKKQDPQNLFRRLTHLFRSGPVIKKKIRTADTTIAVADKTKSSGTLLFQKSLAPTYATITANAYNLSERLMRYQDFQEMEYCVHGGQLIASPDAPDGYIRIDELAAMCAADPSKTFVVYSYDHEKNRVVPAYGRQARQTRVDHAWKVTLDNGKEVIGSSNHQLMLRDGTYRELGDLKPGDAMMPFYRKDLFANAEEGTKGYSWIYTMDDRFRGWTKEHQLVAEWIADRKLTEDECVHHINFVKTDNRPENLKIMTKSDHDSYHAAINNAVKWAPENTEWIEEFKKKHSSWMRDNAPTARKDVTFARILEISRQCDFNMRAVSRMLDVDLNVIYSRLTAAGFKSYETFTLAYKGNDQLEPTFEQPTLNAGINDISIDKIHDLITEDDTKKTLSVKLGCTVNVLDKFLARRLGLTWLDLRRSLKWNVGSDRAGGRPKGSNSRSLTFKQICDAYTPGLTLPRLSEKLGVNKNTIVSRLAQNGHVKYSEFASSYQNCKVVSIEYVGIMPLYDLTVDGYKNFATDSVISHNTPEIAAALDIYADEAVSSDEKGRCLHVYSDNEKIREILEDLFYNTLNTEFNLRSWARNLPVHKDTVIPLLDGRNVTIEQLAREHEAGKENWVYSVQDKTNKIVPGKVSWCGLTRKDSELVRVWLDDGTYVDCTPDHEWIMRDGSSRRADALLEGESLMPFYREQHAVGKDYRSRSYERVYDPGTGKWVYTHRVMPLHDWSSSDAGKVVHHVNFVRHDNTPTNLRVMSRHDHDQLHRSLASRYNTSELHKQHNVQRSETMKSLWSNNMRKAQVIANMQIKFDTKCVDIMIERLSAHGKYVSPKVLGAQLKNDEFFMCHFRAINDGTKRDLTRSLCTHSGIKNLLRKVGYDSYIDLVKARVPSIAGTSWFHRAEKKSVKMSGVVPAMRSNRHTTLLNHKVAKVEKLAQRSDVYCMEVLGPSGQHDRHNFAVLATTDASGGYKSTSGVMLRNCKYGDFFMYNDVSPDYGVVSAFPIPVNEIEREENYDRDDPFAVRYRWVTLGNRVLENWEVTHFRLLGNDMFLPYGSSVIEPARRIWRQLILIEDAMLVYRVVRAPERRVFYIDIANIPAQDVPTYVEEQRKNLRTNQVVDRNTGRVDLRYNPLPIHKDTPVPLLDGRTLTIEEIAKEYAEGKTNWVYSVQDKTKKVVPGKVSWCGKNYTAETLTKVWLDDGSYVITAPEHPYVMSDGTSKRADEILLGDSLMSAYRDLNNRGYERIVEPNGDLTSTHVMVARDVHKEKYDRTQMHVVHHKIDLGIPNKRNNNPDRLEVMDFWQHRKMHAEHCELTLNTPDQLAVRREKRIAYNKSPEKREKTAEQNRFYKKAQKMGELYNGTELHKLHNVNRKTAQLKSWEQNKPARSEAMQWIIPNDVVSFVFDQIKSNPKIGREEVTKAIRTSSTMMNSLVKANESNNRDVSKFNVTAVINKLNRMGYIDPGYGDLKKFAIANTNPVNHQVVKIETITDANDDVYCMTVVGSHGEDDRHNFAVNGLGGQNDDKLLKSLIFVLNSVDEDYFIPVRGNDTGTRIETLAGGQNTAAVEDVAYIQKKLFAALKIPRAYLGYDEMLSCLVSTTCIPTFGRTGERALTIKQLSDECKQDPITFAGRHHAYAWDHVKRKIVPARILRAWETKQVTKLIDVTFDDGTTLRCTPEHPIMLRNGSGYRNASCLRPGDAIMPLRLRESLRENGDWLHGYSCFNDPDTGKWLYSHRVAGEYRYGKLSPRNVMHHVDFDKKNNAPENLQFMIDGQTHREFHAEHNKKNKVYVGSGNPRFNHGVSFGDLVGLSSTVSSQRELRDKAGIGQTVFGRLMRDNSHTWQSFSKQYVPNARATHRCIGYDVTYETVAYAARRLGHKASRETVAQALGVSTAVVDKRIQWAGFANWGSFKRSVVWSLNRGAVLSSIARHGSLQAAYDADYSDRCGFQAMVRFIRSEFGGARSARIEARKLSTINHTVVDVKEVILDTPVPVYDLEVENHHNFAARLTGQSGKYGQHQLTDNCVMVSNSKATLAQEDIRFSRTVNVIQKVMLAELNKLAIIHLYAHGFEADDLQNFTLRLSNPSTVAQQQKLELWRAKFEIAGSAPEGFINKDFVRKEIWGLNDEECKIIDKGRLKDKMVDGTIESAQPAGGEEGGGVGGGGGADLFGGGGEEPAGEEGGGPTEELPPEENASEEPEEETKPDVELLTSADTNDDDETFGLRLSAKDVEAPVKVQRQLDRVLYNRGRVRTHGASKTHMPDFQKMTSNDNHAMDDPYDNDWLKSVVSNPLGESQTFVRPNLPADLESALQKWSAKHRPTVANKLLNETNVIDEPREGDLSNTSDENNVLIIDDDGDEDDES